MAIIQSRKVWPPILTSFSMFLAGRRSEEEGWEEEQSLEQWMDQYEQEMEQCTAGSRMRKQKKQEEAEEAAVRAESISQRYQSRKIRK